MGQGRPGQGRAGQRPVDKCHINLLQDRAGQGLVKQCSVRPSGRHSQCLAPSPASSVKFSLMAPAVLEGKSATTGWLSEWQFGLHATPLGGGGVCPSGPTK